MDYKMQYITSISQKHIRNFNEKYIPITESGCYIWTACTDRDGYGKIKIDSVYRPAHRVSYIIHKGIIPEGICVCHTCDTPSCVNPDHLWLGTQYDNQQDKANKGRVSGARHPRYDHKIRTFKHKDGATFTGTRYDFYTKFKVKPNHISAMIKYYELGEWTGYARKEVMGWSI